MAEACHSIKFVCYVVEAYYSRRLVGSVDETCYSRRFVCYLVKVVIIEVLFVMCVDKLMSELILVDFGCCFGCDRLCLCCGCYFYYSSISIGYNQKLRC